MSRKKSTLAIFSESIEWDTHMIIHEKAYPRSALIGNPSDGYFGKTIAFMFRNYCAEVTLYESPCLEILPSVRTCRQSQYGELQQHPPTACASSLRFPRFGTLPSQKLPASRIQRRKITMAFCRKPLKTQKKMICSGIGHPGLAFRPDACILKGYMYFIHNHISTRKLKWENTRWKPFGTARPT